MEASKINSLAEYAHFCDNVVCKLKLHSTKLSFLNIKLYLNKNYRILNPQANLKKLAQFYNLTLY